MAGGECPARLALRAPRMFDGRRWAGPVTVIVADGLVMAVDTKPSELPADMAVADLGDAACLLPGLIDCHVHLSLNGTDDAVRDLLATSETDLLAGIRDRARLALRAGVTTVRDLGDRDYSVVAARQRDAGGPEVLPEILASGPPLTSDAGHCWFLGGEVRDASAARAAVRDRKAHGCDVVKVMVSGGFLTAGTDPGGQQLGAGILAAIVDEAAWQHLPTAAHVHGPEPIAAAVAAGFGTLEHVSFLTSAGVRRDASAIRRVAASNCTVSATVGVRAASGPPSPAAAQMYESIGALFAEGATVIAGSDAGTSAQRPHDMFPRSIAALAGLGMGNEQALRAATSGAAQALGLGGRKGRIAPGYDADLVAVDGNPQADLAALTRIRAVLCRGRPAEIAGGGGIRQGRTARMNPLDAPDTTSVTHTWMTTERTS